MHKPVEAPFSSIQNIGEDGIRGVKHGQWKDIRLNKYGFYDSDDYAIDKKTHAVRIMCLGDSITFGTFTPPHNWPNYLEQLLQDRQIDAEVINASMPGNTLTQLVNLFESDYVRFDPDILIIYKGFRSYMDKPGFKYPVKETPLLKMLRKSFFFSQQFDKSPRDPHTRLIKERKKRNIIDLVDTPPPASFERYRADLKRLANICKMNDIKLVVSPFILLGDEKHYTEFLDNVYGTLYYYPALTVEAYVQGTVRFNEITKEFAEKTDLIYVDVSTGIEHNFDFFVDNMHLTPKGSMTFAENYLKALSPMIINMASNPNLSASE